MSWIDVAQIESVKSTAEQFTSAVIVWLKKPHVIDRRLCGAEVKWFLHGSPSCDDISNIALQLRTQINSVPSLRLTLKKLHLLLCGRARSVVKCGCVDIIGAGRD